MPDKSNKPIFFGSDTEEEMDQLPMELDEEERPSESTKGVTKKPLFFASSDDERDASPSELRELVKRRAGQPVQNIDENEAISSSPPLPSSPLPRASSHTSISPPSAKKRKITPPVMTKKAKVQKVAPKPKIQAPISESVGFESAYLGSLLVPNAWSTCKGRGWINSGEAIHIQKNDEEMSTVSSKSGTKNPNAPVRKQLKLTSMFKNKDKAVSSKPAKKGKIDTVVRFTNSRGFEIGRLPQDIAAWVRKLLDLGIIMFKNCTMVDCPENLHTGAEMLLQLRIYILAEAFGCSHPSTSSDEPRSMFNEGQETFDEQMLRERKELLLQLFKRINIRPVHQSSPLKDFTSSTDLLEKMSQGKDISLNRKGNYNANLEDRDNEDDDDEEVLTEGQLDLIYKKAQKNDRSMPEMDSADTFTLTLRPYQRQALLWMHSLETGTAAARDADSMHPLWEEYRFPYEELDDGIIDMTEEQRPFYFSPYSGELSVKFPRAEKKCRGGILAKLFDCLEMGMGKTIMISSLLHTSRDVETAEPSDMKVKGSSSTYARVRQLKLDAAFRPIHEVKATLAPNTTLIIAPTSLMSQWAKELERSSKKGSIEILIWHGTNRDDLDSILGDESKINVVITSYGVLGSEWTRHESSSRNRSPLFQVEWLRVVLDEAHNCKSRSSRTAKACCALKARRRWALTGTPIVNKLEDLYSLLKFLDFTPWSDYSFFRSFITLPFLNRDPKAVEIVQVILESVLLRREKTMRDEDGKPIIELPTKEVILKHLNFSPLERKIYDSLYINAKKNFERLQAKGLVGKNYTHILAMLMRLRRAVLHPSLAQIKEKEDTVESDGNHGQIDVNALIAKFTEGTEEDDEGPSAVFAEEVLKKLDEADGQECVICLDIMDQPVLVPNCLHSCCKGCVLAFLQSFEERDEDGHCPICRRGPLKASQLLEVIRKKPFKTKTSVSNDDNLDGDRASSPAVVLRKNDFDYSTKLTALSEDLCRLRDQDPCFRAVVFSQFTSFLDLIEVVLRRDGFAFYRFDGEMNVKKKAEAVEEFTRPSRSGKVFIVSLKAGGVGLNLTVADHVFMMDCWWNAAIENQAIDRVHRIGQERTVYVKKYIISDTIEDRILQIQKRKTAIVKGALGGKSSDPESMENLKIMFGEVV